MAEDDGPGAVDTSGLAAGAEPVTPESQPKSRRTASRSGARRTTKKAPTPTEPTAPAQAADVGDDQSTAPATEPPPPAPRRTRRTARPRKAADAPPSPTPTPEAAEPVPVQQADAVAEAATQDAAPAVPARSPRPPRKRRPKAVEPPALAPVAEEPEVTSTPTAEPVASADVEAAPKPAPKRAARGGGARSRKQPAKTSSPSGARIVVKRGFPELVIDGETVTPAFFFGNAGDASAVRRVQSQMHRALKAGVRVFSTLVDLPCPLPPDDAAYEALDERIAVLADVASDAFLMPRVVFSPAKGWREQYPEEVHKFASGATDDPSVASDHFWDEAERSLRLLIEHIQRTSYGRRVIGYHLERGEWFNSAENGFDRSFANREGFRRWLREKYHNDEVALRAAWFDGSAQFYTAEIPPESTPMPDIGLLDAQRDRRQIDFAEYSSDVVASRLVRLSEAVKSATGNAALVSVCYGYTWEFTHTSSGHLALQRILEAPTIDIISGPAIYSERALGSSGACPSPSDSAAVHGKLWILEDDTKTYLAQGAGTPDPYNPKMETRQATEAAHQRAIGAALAHQTGIAWMDLWGEGWLDADDVWSRVGSFIDLSGRQAKLRKQSSPEVVALIDERSLTHLNSGDALISKIIRSNRDVLMRCGASVGLYLQSDITEKAFPTDARLYVFLNPYRLRDEERQAVRDRLRRPGRTLVWMYAVGQASDRTTPDEPGLDAVDIHLRVQSWNTEVGTRITQPGHPIVQFVADRQLGSRRRINPSYYVDDDGPNLTVLGEYAQSGLPSLAVRTVDGCSSVFCGEPVLSPELLRGLCRFAGAHLYTRAPEDYVQAGNGWLSIHVTRDGYRTLSVPEGMRLFDVSEGVLSGEGHREYRTAVRGHTTRLFAVGPPETFRKLGLVEKPAAKLPTPPPLPAATLGAEPEPGLEHEESSVIAPRTPITPETEADAESVYDGNETDAGDAVDDVDVTQPGEAETKRRRRRRGGRGRGRRRKTEGSDASAAGGATSESAGSEA